jgi:Rieske 2Fe-2S family protein
MTIFERASVTGGAKPLERKYYTDETIYEVELERIFFDRWICIGRSEQIANPGDYFLFDLGGESVIVVRDREGVARAHINVCRHRGTRLCSAERGQFAGSIQCPYHAWTFGLDGKLLAARNMRDVPGFDKADYPLFSPSLVEWEGFLMIDMSRDPKPFEHVFAPLLGKWTNWRLGELRIGATIDYDVQANWKLLIENYSECYHCPVIHPALTALSPPESGKNDLAQGQFLGGPMDLSAAAHSMTVGGTTARPPILGLPREDHHRVYYYSLFPNTLLSLHPDYVMVHFIRPLGAGRTLVRCVWLFEPEVLARPDFNAHDAVQFWDMTNREDWNACEISQHGINSRFYRPGPYAQSEGLLWAFDRYYLEALEGTKSQ